MKNMAKVCVLIISSIFFFQLNANSARAWFSICNRIGANNWHRGGSPDAPTVYVAFKYLDISDNRAPSHQRYNNGWVTKKWYRFSAKECGKVYPHELWRRNRYYYVHVWGRTNGFVKIDIGKRQNYTYPIKGRI